MDHSSASDLKLLAQDPEFKNLTVEQAIRLLGEREKQHIENERMRVVHDLTSRLQMKAENMKQSR
jgi:hypothetical protein